MQYVKEKRRFISVKCIPVCKMITVSIVQHINIIKKIGSNIDNDYLAGCLLVYVSYSGFFFCQLCVLLMIGGSVVDTGSEDLTLT